jgi:hypothetical protein
MDYLAVAGGRGIESAGYGALIGFIAGALLGSPSIWLMIGAALGGVNGVTRGVKQVQAGWRVRVVCDSNGMPVMTVQVE